MAIATRCNNLIFHAPTATKIKNYYYTLTLSGILQIYIFQHSFIDLPCLKFSIYLSTDFVESNVINLVVHALSLKLVLYTYILICEHQLQPCVLNYEALMLA